MPHFTDGKTIGGVIVLWNDSVITDGGVQLLSAWAQGGELTVFGAAAGETVNANAAQMGRQTDVLGTKHTLEISDFKKVDGGVRYTVRITAGNAAYVARQIGIYAKLDNGGEQLIALYQDGTGISVPASSDMPGYVYYFYATVNMATDAEISVTIPSDTYADKADIAELQEDISGKQDKISDLATIRLGAALGATALQSVPVDSVRDALLNDDIVMESQSDQKKVCSSLGAVHDGDFELIADITLPENIDSFILPTESNGNGFKLKAIRIITETGVSSESGGIEVHIGLDNTEMEAVIFPVNFGNTKKYERVTLMLIGGVWFTVESECYSVNTWYNQGNRITSQGKYIFPGRPINKIWFAKVTSVKMPEGTNFKVYGVKA